MDFSLNTGYGIVHLEKRCDAVPVMFTIGHSNHSFQEFLELLKKHDITLVVDVRSQPYSRYVSHFNRRFLAEHLPQAGIGYLFLGAYLGGRPKEKEYYRPDGTVDYNVLQQSPRFRKGIEEVKRLAEKHRLVLLCSEEDPSRCHRKLLVGEVLVREGIRVLHIRGTGEIEEEHSGATVSPITLW